MAPKLGTPRLEFGSFNAPKGGNAVLTKNIVAIWMVLDRFVSMPRRAVMLF